MCNLYIILMQFKLGNKGGVLAHTLLGLMAPIVKNA